MSDRINSKNPNMTTKTVNGQAERNITSEDMKEYKNAMDSTRRYVSGDEELSSSSHNFSLEQPAKKK